MSDTLLLTTKRYDSILQLYKNSTTPESDKSLIIFALLAPDNTTQCQTTLSLISGKYCEKRSSCEKEKIMDLGNANSSTTQQILPSQILRYNSEFCIMKNKQRQGVGEGEKGLRICCLYCPLLI
jgi:hypothetical protein